MTLLVSVEKEATPAPPNRLTCAIPCKHAGLAPVTTNERLAAAIVTADPLTRGEGDDEDHGLCKGAGDCGDDDKDIATRTTPAASGSDTHDDDKCLATDLLLFPTA
mmetsp:Transcript_20929/g.45636  ORF Transcript_20929/g.45636 Transcript_20929/m.45636 type:complete len:106 (+) Transcript_20929:1054-1371(+)